MFTALRQRVLTRLFGSGLGAFVAATASGWLIDQVRSAFSGEGERLDTTRLRPGESYVVTTRPPMTRAERRLTDERDRLDARIATMTRPRRSTIRLARRYRRASSAATRRNVASGSRRAARVERLGSQLDRRLQPSVAADRLIARRDELDAEIARRAAAARAAAPAPRRPSTPRVFR